MRALADEIGPHQVNKAGKTNWKTCYLNGGHRFSTALPGLKARLIAAARRVDAVGDDEAIILCPANHSLPISVTPVPGTPGYEAVATCLASPEVRARTEGMIAWRPA